MKRKRNDIGKVFLKLRAKANNGTPNGLAQRRSKATSARAGVGQRYYIPLFSPQEFIGRRLLEKLNPWIHHLDRYVEGLLGRL